MALHFAQGKGDSSEIDDLTEEWRARLWPGGWNPHDPPAEPVGADPATGDLCLYDQPCASGAQKLKLAQVR